MRCADLRARPVPVISATVPSVSLRRARIALALASCLLLAPAYGTAEICCDQLGSGDQTPAQMNANLVCPVSATSCSIAAQTARRPGDVRGELAGCALDFGDRA